MNVWELYVADRTGVRQCQLDTYESAEIIARANDVSTWSVKLPSDTEAGRLFLTDSFARLEIVLDHAVWRSGPVAHLKREVEIDGDMLEVAGVDDTVWLARRLAHPQPTKSAPPYSSTAYDTRTGTVTQVLARYVDVNAGAGAVTARQVPGLTAPTPVSAGPSIRVSARWQNLLQLLQDTARPSGVLFDVVDLTFHAYLPTNRGAVFSAGLETLAGWTMTADAATANKVVVAGGGEGTARTITEVTDPVSIGTWGLVETFQDRRDSTDPADLLAAGQETLAAGVKPTTVVFVPLDTDGQAFGRDWVLGDIVTVIAGGLTVVDQIRQIRVTLDDQGATVIPSVGSAAGDLALFRELAGLDRRVRQLERI